MILGHGMANSKRIIKRLKREPNLYVRPVQEELSCKVRDLSVWVKRRSIVQ